ncbi:MAG: 16S rRNA (cytosine(1402)-N(4))-methyltransferase RsmH [Alphaproteobacteria bacterium]|nr:16S rRNA (cytosine(1402)-N(4))-methyltransferase RsmH [Alphaproteobacteria bacterium]
MKHIPVLLDGVLATLGDIRDQTIIDATFGAGGYSRAFLERGAAVIAFDRDPSVIPTARAFAREFHLRQGSGGQVGDRFQFINSPFSEIGNLTETVNHIVFDFGVSSMQIDTPQRGFSWRFDAPLDMRMSDAGMTAAQLIENSSPAELARILRDYGDVKKAMPIAIAMKEKLPKTTLELRDLIYNPKDIAPVFQALRIAVNDELGQIETALNAVPKLLAPGGICACVTFHSLEDRLVKNKFREWTEVKGDPRLPAPDITAPFRPLRTIKPSAEEIAANPRARSAHLRAARKL